MFENDGLIISVLTVVIADLILRLLLNWHDKRVQRTQIKLDFLNPLRIHAIELHDRWEHTLYKVKENELESMRYIKKSSEIKDVDSKWFYEKGYYLISTSYIISCFFAYYYKFKFDLPILYIDGFNYDLLKKSLKTINDTFRDRYKKGAGIYDFIQYDIGQNMFDDTNDTIISYTDFLKLLKNDEINGGLLRLVNFCIDSVKEDRIDTLKKLYQVVGDLISNLDMIIESEISSKNIIKSQVLSRDETPLNHLPPNQ